MRLAPFLIPFLLIGCLVEPEPDPVARPERDSDSSDEDLPDPGEAPSEDTSSTQPPGVVDPAAPGQVGPRPDTLRVEGWRDVPILSADIVMDNGSVQWVIDRVFDEYSLQLASKEIFGRDLVVDFAGERSQLPNARVLEWRVHGTGSTVVETLTIAQASP